MTLDAAPANITAGETLTLTLSTSHADTVTLTPLATTTYTLTAEGTGRSATATATVTVENPFVLAIISPTDGATVDGNHVFVQGTFLNSTGNETGITVNGVLALIYEGQFAANQVPLAEGANTLTVTATDSAGHRYSREIRVHADTSADALTISADPQSGAAPLETVLTRLPILLVLIPARP